MKNDSAPEIIVEFDIRNSPFKIKNLLLVEKRVLTDFINQSIALLVGAPFRLEVAVKSRSQFSRSLLIHVYEGNYSKKLFPLVYLV